MKFFCSNFTKMLRHLTEIPNPYPKLCKTQRTFPQSVAALRRNQKLKYKNKTLHKPETRRRCRIPAAARPLTLALALPSSLPANFAGFSPAFHWNFIGISLEFHWSWSGVRPPRAGVPAAGPLPGAHEISLFFCWNFIGVSLEFHWKFIEISVEFQ